VEDGLSCGTQTAFLREPTFRGERRGVPTATKKKSGQGYTKRLEENLERLESVGT